MTRAEFRRAYRAARWTLRNRPFADLHVALPASTKHRAQVLAVLVMAGKLTIPHTPGLRITIIE